MYSFVNICIYDFIIIFFFFLYLIEGHLVDWLLAKSVTLSKYCINK